MKHLLFVAFMFIAVGLCAQVAPPQAFNYSAVVRNGVGTQMANQNISVQFTIYQGTATGTQVYVETHTTTTNSFGLFNTAVGTGTVQSGSFTAIDWSADKYYLGVAIDTAAGSNFVQLSTAQLLSVPYALYSGTAGSAATDHDTSATNELQTLSISGDTITISNGNSIVIPAAAPQTLALNGDTIRISNGNYIVLTPGQNASVHVSLTGDTLYVGSSWVILPGASGANGGIHVPYLTPTPFSVVSVSGFVSGGLVTNDGGATVTARGICYGTSPNPTTAGSTTSNGTGIGTFGSTVTGLVAGVTYYVRAYATNSAGTAYGNEISVVTATIALPSVTTGVINRLDTTLVGLYNNVTADGGAAVTARGIVYGTSPGVNLSNASFTTDGNGTGNFQSNASGLTPNTTYYVNAYATNSVGTAYGTEVSFLTVYYPLGAVVTSGAVSNITSSTATGGGTVVSDGGSPVLSRGVCWAPSGTPVVTGPHTVDGSGMGLFTSSITGLALNTSYNTRAYCIRATDTTYGAYVVFSTPNSVLPQVTTNPISVFTYGTTASGGGLVVSSAVPVIARGICYRACSCTPNIGNSVTVDGSGLGAFSSSLTGLIPSTVYNARAYATLSNGVTAYGNQVAFTTPCAGQYCVGQHTQGGTIFYVDSTGNHGLVISDMDVDSNVAWTNGSVAALGVNIASFGAGQTNTNTIVAALGSSGNYAAKTCDNLVLNGYSDWYLPSYSELSTAINGLYYISVVQVYTIGGVFWSSTESGGPGNQAECFSTGSGNFSFQSKTTLQRVRAVRSF